MVHLRKMYMSFLYSFYNFSVRLKLYKIKKITKNSVRQIGIYILRVRKINPHLEPLFSSPLKSSIRI